MSRNRHRFRLGPHQRPWLYGSFAVLFLSGAVWWVLAHWFNPDTGFGPQENPLQPWLLRLHGAAAMIALVVLGSLLPTHVRTAWHAGKNRFTGGGIIALCATLTLTGYGLYYVGGEGLRAFISLSHLWLGLAFPVALIGHIRRGRTLTRAATASKSRTSPPAQASPTR